MSADVWGLSQIGGSVASRDASLVCSGRVGLAIRFVGGEASRFNGSLRLLHQQQLSHPHTLH